MNSYLSDSELPFGSLPTNLSQETFVPETNLPEDSTHLFSNSDVSTHCDTADSDVSTHCDTADSGVSTHCDTADSGDISTHSKTCDEDTAAQEIEDLDRYEEMSPAVRMMLEIWMPNFFTIPILTPKKNWKFIDTMWMNINSIGSLVERRAAKGHLTISELFDQHFALSVRKSRYLPVKGTTDLLLLQSDLYIFKEGTITRNSARENPADPSIELGPVFENVNDFRERFKSIPSVIGLNSLKVTGDVWFGTGITLKGKVVIHARPGMKIVIPDGAVLENKIITSQAAAGGVSL